MQAMTRDEILDLFRRSGALLEGHFRLTSGLHSSGYLQCALVLSQPESAEALGRALADRIRRVADAPHGLNRHTRTALRLALLACLGQDAVRCRAEVLA